MDILEYISNKNAKLDNFIVRKVSLPDNDKINLYGVRGSGKSLLALDFIQEEIDSSLYIDMNDPNLIFKDISASMLDSHIASHHIDTLILDHYQPHMLDSFPSVKKLIIVTRTMIKANNFIYVNLLPLDYEEFLAFDHSSTYHSGFNNFLRAGTLPQFARTNKTIFFTMKVFFHYHFTHNEQKLLIVLAQHHTKHLTAHQIYIYAKEKFKVSKDWLYKTIKEFTEEGIIIFIENRYTKSGKKMLLFDFAFAKYLTTEQPFISQFDTMIVLALKKESIFFETLGSLGYITNNNELIIPAPFESENSLWTKSQIKFAIYKSHKITKVTIITVSNNYSFSIDTMNFEAMPFTEWSIIDENES